MTLTLRTFERAGIVVTKRGLVTSGRAIAGPTPGGLDFPGIDESTGPEAAPNYSDFLYFSLTVAATAQTSDVAVTTRAMRKLVVMHAVVSFGFNTMVLALAINIAASQF